MAGKTHIQWTDATWNPIRGCSRVSEGCRNCYAEKVAHRFSGAGQPYEGLTHSSGLWNGVIRVVDGRDGGKNHLLDPMRWKDPRMVFVNSMSDLFHENLADSDVCAVFTVMRNASQHTFQVLTKRAARMQSFMSRLAWRTPTTAEDKVGVGGLVAYLVPEPPPEWHVHQPVPPLRNVWLGVSVEDQPSADTRIQLLCRTPSAVRWVSYEPALAPVDFTDWMDHECGDPPHFVCPGQLDWIVVGGESQSGARPFHVVWAESVLKQRKGTRTRVFVKQLGSVPVVPAGRFRHYEWRKTNAKFEYWRGEHTGLWRVLLADKKAGDMSEWPKHLRVREYPETA